MIFEPAEWGTFGQWASALGTTAAFSATFYVIRRDSKVRRYSQARKVAYYRVDLGKDRGGIWSHTVENLSDEPIYDVELHLVVRGRSRKSLVKAEILTPKDKLPPLLDHADAIDAQFRDNSGRLWRRTVDGKLHEISRLHRTLERKSRAIDRYGFGRTVLRALGRKRKAAARTITNIKRRRENKRIATKAS